MQEDALSVGTEEAALAVKAHIDAEAVDTSVVALEGLSELQLVGREEWAFHKTHYGIAAASFMIQLSHPYLSTGKTIA